MSLHWSPPDGQPVRGTLVFSHGNGFPAGTYSQVLAGMAQQGYRVHAIDRLGHDPHYPVSSNWPHLVRQLADFVQQLPPSEGPLFLVGHSLGGFLSLMCAARYPDLAPHPVRGVVLLDAPVLSGWRAQLVRWAKYTQLIERFSPGKISRQRRQHWPDPQTAQSHFARKSAFAAWDPTVLTDYIQHGTAPSAGPDGASAHTLRFERRIETRIYDTLPHNLDHLLRRHPLRCPLAFIGGERSNELRQVGLRRTLQLLGPTPGQRLQMLNGSHLFPMEQPASTVQAIERALQACQDTRYPAH